MSGMSPHRLQTYAADKGVLGGAAAAQKELAAAHPAPPGAPDLNRTVPVNANLSRDRGHAEAVAVVSDRPGGESVPGSQTPAIRLHVRSHGAHTSKEQALNDAVIVAQEQIKEALKSLDPPVNVKPSWEKVRYQYLKPESVKEVQPSEADKDAWKAANLDTSRVWVDIDVEVSEDQVRELRADHRVGTAGWVGAVGFLLVLALYGFLRLDAWTRGYLTTGLAVGIAVAVGAAVVLLLVIA
jgi:hypothetical protein